MLDSIGEWLVEVLGEGLAWVVGQYPNEHNRIVLDVWTRVVLLGKKRSDLPCGSSCCSGTRDGGFDNSREMEDFFAL